MATAPVEYVDSIAAFDAGMNSGLDPRLLPKNRLAFALNSTVRGGLIQNRPPFTKMLTFAWDSPVTQASVEQGLFQGACYFKPDTGPQCLIASISGGLYRFNIIGNTVSVSDISIEDDRNPSDRTQAWLWQADKWVIVQDGISLPIFYDGTTSRRSNGASVELGVVNAAINSFTTPEVGQPVTVTTNASYTGGYDFPVLFHGEFYQPVKTAGAYDITLENISDNSGATYPEGTQVLVQPSVVAVVGAAAESSTLAVTAVSIPASTINITITMTKARTIPVGTVLYISSQPTDSLSRTFNNIISVWRVTGIVGTTLQLSNASAFSVSANRRYGFRFTYGTQIKLNGSTAPNVVLGTLTSDLLLPLGSSTATALSQSYTGNDNQMCFINGREYEITGIPQESSGTTLILINLSDAAGVLVNSGNFSIMSVPEIPAGRMGAYVMGQNWFSMVDGLTYGVSDISRGPSGTQANDYRDSILKIVELTFGGGSFAIPSSGSYITSIIGVPKLDESLGQGPVQFGTALGVFTAQAPFDYLNATALTQPLLPQVLIGPGPLGQNSNFIVNSDTHFRTSEGITSLKQARRDFQTDWGNTSLSEEVDERILIHDNEQLLPWGTGVVFDNREFMSVSPQASSGGVLHSGMVVTNLDPISSLREKQPPVYDGLWTGVNALQFLSGQFNNVQRCFIFSYNVDQTKIELYELLPSSPSNRFDNGYARIVWGFESASLFLADVKPKEKPIKLMNGKIALDNVIGRVGIQAWYRFDNGCWYPWTTTSVCANPAGPPQNFPDINLGEPPTATCNTSSGKNSRIGYNMQVKFEFSGSCRFISGKFQANSVDEPEFGKPSCGDQPCTSIECPEIREDLVIYSLQTNTRFNANEIVVHVPCPDGWVCPTNLTVTYPPGTFVLPDPGQNLPDQFIAQGCQSLIVANSAEELFALLAAQQAQCQAIDNPPTDWQPPVNPPPPPTGGKSVYLGALTQVTSCTDASFTATATATTSDAQGVAFEVIGGALPTGITMTQAGKVATFSGTTSAPGYYSFTLKATHPSGAIAVRIYNVTVAGIVEDSLPSGEVGSSYSEQLTIDGPTTGSEVWSVASGSLPPGLSLNSSTGEITGTPTTEGDYSFVVCFSNNL